MNFKKLSALMLALLLVAALFVGCAKEEKPADSTAPQSTEAGKTEPATTEAPETEAPETEAPETEAPETDAPETDAPETEAAGTEPQPLELDEIFVTMNDVKVVLGTPYADVKDQLGEETSPEDVQTSCEPDSDWCRIYHHYRGIDVVEDQNGNIANFEMREPDDSVAFMGQIKLGTPVDTVYAVLGQPEPNEYGIFYTLDAVNIAIYPSEDGENTVSSIMVMAN